MHDCIASLQATEEGRGLEGCPRLRADGGSAGLVSRAAPPWWCRNGTSSFPSRETLKDGYKALTARPFLPRYFPGYDLYLWIDGDCWVQQATRSLCSSPPRGRVRWPWHPRSTARCGTTAMPGRNFRRSTAPRSRPPSAGRCGNGWIRYPLINAGVFALAADAPHWQGWADLLGDACRSAPTGDDPTRSLNVLAWPTGASPANRCPAAATGRSIMPRRPGMPAAACSSSPPCPTSARHPASHDLHQAPADARCARDRRAAGRPGPGTLVALAGPNRGHIAPHGRNAVPQDARAGQRFRRARCA